ncbi:hypothetical protein Tco_1285784 [Tanacetum coccineum]
MFMMNHQELDGNYMEAEKRIDIGAGNIFSAADCNKEDHLCVYKMDRCFENTTAAQVEEGDTELIYATSGFVPLTGDSASELDQGNIAAMTLDRLLLMLGFCLTSIQGCLDADVRECFDVVIGCLDDAIMGCLAAVIMFSYCLIVDFVISRQLRALGTTTST